MEPVLVTGAAGGQQGSTGRQVATLLLAQGQAVRAFVRTDDARAAELRRLGAEVVVGDLREIADVLSAVRGVRRAFFTYPVTEGLLDATGAFAAAARHEGLERVVEVSQLAAAPDAGTPRMRQHWVSEQVFDRAGVGAVHLRAAVFFENLAVLAAAGGGLGLVVPLGPPDTVIPLVAAADVARVATNLLLGPSRDVDPVCRLAGEILTVGEVADAFSAAAGHEVKYVDAPPDEWRRQALAAGFDPHAVEHLSKLWEIFRTTRSDDSLYRVTGSIEQIGGQRPVTLREFLRTHADAGRRSA